MRIFRISTLVLFLSLSLSAMAQGRQATQYPVILAHGLLASDVLFSWRKVQVSLWLRGYRTYVTEVSAIGSVEERAKQLASQVDRILRRTGADKVNIIAHSMGGLDGRYLISRLGYEQKVASLTTIATPHRGSSAADAILEDIKNQCDFFCRLIQTFARFYNEQTLNPSLETALYNLSTPFLETFNLNTPDAAGVYYQSWAALAEPDGSPALIRSLLREPYQTIYAVEGPNDGLVSLRSAQWGDYRGWIPSDHLGVIGKGLYGRNYQMVPWAFIRDIIEELNERGY